MSNYQERVGTLFIHKSKDTILHCCTAAIFRLTAPSFCWLKDSGRSCEVGRMARTNGQAEGLLHLRFRRRHFQYVTTFNAV